MIETHRVLQLNIEEMKNEDFQNVKKYRNKHRHSWLNNFLLNLSKKRSMSYSV